MPFSVIAMAKSNKYHTFTLMYTLVIQSEGIGENNLELIIGFRRNAKWLFFHPRLIGPDLHVFRV